MDFRENTRLWHLTYHREAAETDEIELARALYEQRIRELEQHIAELEEEIEEIKVEDETLYLNFDGSSLKHGVEHLLKLL